MNLDRPLILVGETVFLVFCFWALPTLAQDSPSISAPDCSPVDVDPDIRISTSHDTYQAVDIKLRNVSEHACYLRGELPTNFMTVNIGAPITQNSVQMCYNCGPDGKSRSSEPLLLGSARVAHQTFVWANKQMSEQIPCIQVNLLELILNSKVLVLFETQNPILSVCSQVLVNPFLLVTETNDRNAGNQENEVKPKSLKLAADKDTYYVGQRIRLRLDMEAPDTGETSVERECSPLFERVRSPDGMTRFDQVASAGDSNCKIITSSTLGSKRTVTLDVN